MTRAEELLLLKQTNENNIMLRSIVNYINSKDSKDFGMNIIANVIGNAITEQK